MEDGGSHGKVLGVHDQSCPAPEGPLSGAAAPSFRRTLSRIAALALSLPVAVAQAQDGAAQGPPRNGYDGDINLVRPIFGPEILPGVDVPSTQRPGTVRGGLVIGYTRNPLVLYQFDEEVGPVVANRIQAWAGASVDITRAFTARVVIPMYLQFGSQVPRYAADGFALGDISIGAHLALLRKPAGGLGLRLDFMAPTSRKDFYSGERLPRFLPGIIAMGDVGIVRIAADVGGILRLGSVETKEEFTLGQEIDAKLGIRVAAIPQRLSVGLTGYARFGFANFLGAAESTGEALVTVAYSPMKWLWVDVSAGRGFTRGYGSSDFRGMVQLRFQRLPRPEDEPDDFVDPFGDNGEGSDDLLFNVRDVNRIISDQTIETNVEAAGLDLSEFDEEEWDEGEITKVETNKAGVPARIKVRYALKFKLGTAELLPESYELLDAVADLLNSDARLGQVVIEGHASPDGPFERNYELSVDRAQAIWRRLVETGVHPQRLAFRGMGEVMPVDEAGGKDELQASRRVIFEVTRVYMNEDEIPELKKDIAYPWNGQPYEPIIPTVPDDKSWGKGVQVIDPGTPAERSRPERSDDVFEDTSFDTSPEDVDLTIPVDEAPGDEAPANPSPADDAPGAPAEEAP